MSEPANAINVYTCPRCGWRMVTINRVEGTTPMFIRCGSDKKCDDTTFPGAVSAIYRVRQTLTPTHEWYRPTTATERKKLRDPNIRQHVALGGLLLRRISDKVEYE